MRDLEPYRDLFQSVWIGWLCRAGHYCLGLSPICAIGCVMCVDDSSVHDLIEQQEGIRFFSLERNTGRRREGRDSAANEIVPGYRDQIEELLLRTSAKRRVLAASIPCRTLAAVAAETGCQLISNPPSLTDWLNNKRNFHTALEELGLPRMAGRWMRFTSARYAELAAEMGPHFFAQLSHGTSGSGTVFIQSENDHESTGKRFQDEPAWVTPDLGRLSVNINALAFETGTCVSCPSIQLEGLPFANSSRGMYCGNDYVAAADLAPGVAVNIVEQTAIVGRWLASLGYRGLFGLDFVLDPMLSKAYAVDLNPRWQGSTAPLTLAECKAGRLPLAVADLACRIGLMSESDVLRHGDEFLRPVNVSHVSLRCPDSIWSEVTGTLRPGVYTLSGGLKSCELAFAREGLRLTDLAAPDEILVAGGVPRPGTLLAPKSHALRFTSERRMTDVYQAAGKLYEALALDPKEADFNSRGHSSIE